jgi:uncharacterized membrane protein (DUF106 family)
MVLENFFENTLGWAIEWSPLGGLVIISFLLTVLVTLVYKYMTDQELLKSIKKEMKDIRKEMKEFREDPKKMMELQKESMEKSMIQMKNTFKPMLITFIPLILVFGWLREKYEVIDISFLGITSWLLIYIYYIFNNL